MPVMENCGVLRVPIAMETILVAVDSGDIVRQEIVKQIKVCTCKENSKVNCLIFISSKIPNEVLSKNWPKSDLKYNLNKVVKKIQNILKNLKYRNLWNLLIAEIKAYEVQMEIENA